jgi:hypothetical protein
VFEVYVKNNKQSRSISNSVLPNYVPQTTRPVNQTFSTHCGGKVVVQQKKLWIFSTRIEKIDQEVNQKSVKDPGRWPVCYKNAY